MTLEELEVYQIAIEISDLAWDIYQTLSKEFRFSTNQQFLDSADSIGANIAEGYGRYHYRDSLKFYYNARGSLYEADYWLGRLNKRGFVKKAMYEEIKSLIETEKLKLNNFINSIKLKI
jgi:four helix bundle protein